MPEPLIKICGLSTPEAVDAAVDSGATHIGLVHFAASPRHVTIDQAAALRRRTPAHVKVALLFVNEQAQTIVDALNAVRPDVVQFHGKEPAEMLAMLRPHLPMEVWKAIGLRDADGLARSARFKDAAHRIIFDAPAKPVPGALPGGNGLAIDWSILAGHQHPMPWGLAGGLTPDNVAEAIRRTGAPLVDTSSGVESAPGVKDRAKIKAFCEAARSAMA